MTRDELIKSIDDNIAEVRAELEVWSDRYDLAEARLDVCRRAIDECKRSISTFEAIKKEAMRV